MEDSSTPVPDESFDIGGEMTEDTYEGEGPLDVVDEIDPRPVCESVRGMEDMIEEPVKEDYDYLSRNIQGDGTTSLSIWSVFGRGWITS